MTVVGKGRRTAPVDNRRSEQALGWRKLYGTRRWKAVRLAQLAEHPLCAICEKAGRITAATVCDHIDKASKNTE